SSFQWADSFARPNNRAKFQRQTGKLFSEDCAEALRPAGPWGDRRPRTTISWEPNAERASCPPGRRGPSMTAGRDFVVQPGSGVGPIIPGGARGDVQQA